MKFTDLEASTIEKASAMLKAIAHPIRLAILGHLTEGKEYTVTELHFFLHIEQSTASHHLGIMRDNDIVTTRREGKHIYYKLKNKNLKKLVDCINLCTCVDE